MDVYHTLKVTVFRDTGEAVETETLVRKRQQDEARPSAEYLAVIKQGYLDWGLV